MSNDTNNNFFDSLAAGTGDVASLLGIFSTDFVELMALATANGYLTVAASGLSMLGILGLIKSTVKLVLGQEALVKAGFSPVSVRGLLGYTKNEKSQAGKMIECADVRVEFLGEEGVKIEKVSKWFDDKTSPMLRVGQKWGHALHCLTVFNIGNYHRQKQFNQSLLSALLACTQTSASTVWIIWISPYKFGWIKAFATIGFHICLILLLFIPLYADSKQNCPGRYVSAEKWRLIWGLGLGLTGVRRQGQGVAESDLEMQVGRKKRVLGFLWRRKEAPRKIHFLQARVKGGNVIHFQGNADFLQTWWFRLILGGLCALTIICYLCQYTVVKSNSGHRVLIWVGVQAGLAGLRTLARTFDPIFDESRAAEAETVMVNNTAPLEDEVIVRPARNPYLRPFREATTTTQDPGSPPSSPPPPQQNLSLPTRSAGKMKSESSRGSGFVGPVQPQLGLTASPMTFVEFLCALRPTTKVVSKKDFSWWNWRFWNTWRAWRAWTQRLKEEQEKRKMVPKWVLEYLLTKPLKDILDYAINADYTDMKHKTFSPRTNVCPGFDCYTLHQLDLEDVLVHRQGPDRQEKWERGWRLCLWKYNQNDIFPVILVDTQYKPRDTEIEANSWVEVNGALGGKTGSWFERRGTGDSTKYKLRKIENLFVEDEATGKILAIGQSVQPSPQPSTSGSTLGPLPRAPSTVGSTSSGVSVKMTLDGQFNELQLESLYKRAEGLCRFLSKYVEGQGKAFGSLHPGRIHMTKVSLNARVMMTSKFDVGITAPPGFKTRAGNKMPTSRAMHRSWNGLSSGVEGVGTYLELPKSDAGGDASDHADLEMEEMNGEVDVDEAKVTAADRKETSLGV